MDWLRLSPQYARGKALLSFIIEYRAKTTQSWIEYGCNFGDSHFAEADSDEQGENSSIDNLEGQETVLASSTEESSTTDSIIKVSGVSVVAIGAAAMIVVLARRKSPEAEDVINKEMGFIGKLLAFCINSRLCCPIDQSESEAITFDANDDVATVPDSSSNQGASLNVGTLADIF